MKSRGFLLGILLVCMIFSSVALRVDAQSNDEKAIRALYQRFSAAVKAKDINTIMSFYVPDESLFVFDAFQPRQYIGAKAYRKDYEGFFAAFPGPVTSEISDLSITTAERLGFAHGIDSWVITDKDGKRLKLVFRFTDVFRKINGKWLIIHEHVSFPVDPATGKADLLSKP